MVLETLVGDFERLQIRYAAIGGFALGVLGTPRQTLDLDFLVNRDDLAKVDTALMGLGYQCAFRSENVTQYQHENLVWGSVDFIHAFRQVSLKMLDRAQICPAVGGRVRLKTARPEDVIGLKLQALCNDPMRRLQEQRDIEALMQHHGAALDWNRIEELYDVFGLIAEARDLREKFSRA